MEDNEFKLILIIDFLIKACYCYNAATTDGYDTHWPLSSGVVKKSICTVSLLLGLDMELQYYFVCP